MTRVKKGSPAVGSNVNGRRRHAADTGIKENGAIYLMSPRSTTGHRPIRGEKKRLANSRGVNMVSITQKA